MNGVPVARVASRAELDAAPAAAWFAAGDGLVVVRSGRMAVSERKEVELDVAGR